MCLVFSTEGLPTTHHMRKLQLPVAAEKACAVVMGHLNAVRVERLLR